MEIFAEGVVIIYKQPNYCSGMYIAMQRCRGFWQQISPNYTYRKSLVNWCRKHNIDPING